MSAHRLRAPAENGALLAVPPLTEAAAVAAANADRLARWDYDFQGRRTARLRPSARRQVLDAARGYLHRHGLGAPDLGDPAQPLVVTGHQPELFHPGVWVKNFAAAGIARARGGTALNLVVDNDVPKSASIRVPTSADGALRVHRVEFDRRASEVPFEELDVVDEDRFTTFRDRVRAALAGSAADPAIDAFWPLALAQRAYTRRLGLRFAAARRALEASWGVRNAEVPLSVLCETEGFLWFASHLLAQLPRFQEVHNLALSRYRARYGIRSRHHPVPALGRQGDWREAPFWVWRATEPRRRPLFVRQLPRTMELRAGGDDRPFLEIPLSPDREACCAVEQLLGLPARQIRLRTRALTTTMFARLVLGDLFLHGIGGAKYDELGDEIIRGFFGLEPPTYHTLSMTLWLDLGGDSAGAGQLEALRRTLRDLQYNPDRHITEPVASEARPLIDAKRRTVASAPDSRAGRLARFRQIREYNEALQPWMHDTRSRLELELSHMLAAVRRRAVARNREFAFVLHSQARLRGAMSAAMTDAAGG